MNGLEHIDVGALAKIMDGADATKGAQIVKQIKALAGVMQGYQFLKQLEKLGKEHPEIQKVGVVCVQTDYNDEGMYDGVYMDAQISMTDAKTGKKLVSKMLSSFDPEEYDAIEAYAKKNEQLMQYGWAREDDSQKEDSVEQTFQKHVGKINSKIGGLFEQTMVGWHTEGTAQAWLGEVIDMKNPMAVLEKVYDKQLVKYVSAHLQKEKLEQSTPMPKEQPQADAGEQAQAPAKKRTRKMGGAL